MKKYKYLKSTLCIMTTLICLQPLINVNTYGQYTKEQNYNFDNNLLEFCRDMINNYKYIFNKYDINDIDKVVSIKELFSVTDIMTDLELGEYLNRYYMQTRTMICDKKGDISDMDISTISNIIMLTSLNRKDATNIGGYNLLKSLPTFETLKNEDIETICNVLKAIDFGSYEVPELSPQIVDYLINYKYENTKDLANALTVLSKHNDNDKVKEFIETSINKLSNNTSRDMYTITAIIKALYTNNIDCMIDTRFNIENKNIVEFMYDEYNYISQIAGFDKNIDIEFIEAEYTNVAFHILKYDGIFKVELVEPDIVSLSSSDYNYINNLSDVKNHWSKESFISLIEDGVIPYSTGQNLYPDNFITKGEFVYYMCNKMNCQETENNYFPENIETKYRDEINAFINWYLRKSYYPEQYAERESFINTYFNENFNPNEYITREEAMFFAVLCELYGDYGYMPDENMDYSDCDIKYKEYVEICVNKGIIKGKNGSIAPKDNLTNGEAAVILNRGANRFPTIKSYI